MHFDVVIVGSGPAGLACAYALSDMRVLILERESRCGGRVHTVDLARQRVDMGACFAFDPSGVPQGLSVDSGGLVLERAPLAICRDGVIHYGATALDCMEGMPLGGELMGEINRFSRTDVDAGTLRSRDAYALLNALLHQIHPGELAEYAGAHQRDGLYTWYPDHWAHGNRALVDALVAQSGARLLLRADVCDVTERDVAVSVSYRTAGAVHRVECSAAVIAATADVAASLLVPRDSHCRQLLQATRYASYIVVALAGFEAARIAEFRCLVCADRALAFVMQQRGPDRDRAVLLCYYCGPRVQALSCSTDEELIALTRRELSALGFDTSLGGSGVEASVKRWVNAGTILSPEYLACGAGDHAWERASDRLYLAGDYVSVAHGVGYGVADAIASGARAARRLRAALKR